MMMNGELMGGGMVAMALICLLFVVVLILAAIALVKYIRSDGTK